MREVKVKRGLKPGRPPNHPPANQYTGIRAQNIDYVRQYLKEYLEKERKQNIRLNRIILLACRMLLACERVYLMTPELKNAARLSEKLGELGVKVAKNEIKLPQLLQELQELHPIKDFKNGVGNGDVLSTSGDTEDEGEVS